MRVGEITWPGPPGLLGGCGLKGVGRVFEQQSQKTSKQRKRAPWSPPPILPFPLQGLRMADAGVPRRSGPCLNGTSPRPAGQICSPDKASGAGEKAGEAKLLFRKDLCFSTCTALFMPFLKHPCSSFPLSQIMPSTPFSLRPAHMLPVLTLTHQPPRSHSCRTCYRAVHI